MMAEAADEHPVKVECGFCFSTGEALVDPKRLPCSHIHCLQCLNMSEEHCGLVQCPLPLCREVFDIPIDKLPAFTAGGNNSLCDICTKKGQENKAAVVYCTTCTSRYCTKHQQSHEDVHEEHKTVPMTEYLLQANKLQVVGCDEHSGQSYIMGCFRCLSVFCVQCLADKSSCTDGKVHQMLSLDELVLEVAKEVDQLEEKIFDREEKLSVLIKVTSKILPEHDQQTEELVCTLRKTKDEQIEAIELKYTKLEEELIERRHNCRTQMVEFMEDEVGAKLSDLSKHRLVARSQLKHCHKVEVIKKYKDIRILIKTLIEEKLPSLEIRRIGTLINRAQNRQAELEMSEEDGVINWDKGLTIYKPVPKSLSLLKNLNMTSNCRSVCHYKGSTYVGLDNYTIARVNGSCQTPSFINFSNYVDGIVAHKDRIYTLMRGNPPTVHVHGLDGRFINRWNHIDTANQTGNGLAVVSSQLVVPDRANKRLTIYSLDGEIIKQILCSQLSNPIAVCGTDNSIIISASKSYIIFRVNIATGQVVWTASLTYPRGIALYRRGYVCVYSENDVRVHTFDIETGKLMSTATDSTNQISSAYDLCIFDDTLIAPVVGTPSLRFYRMNKDCRRDCLLRGFELKVKYQLHIDICIAGITVMHWIETSCDILWSSYKVQLPPRQLLVRFAINHRKCNPQ